ncbi:UNVERIFIED_CONTAM: hypothetical protein ACS92_07935 [Bacillus cereus]
MYFPLFNTSNFCWPEFIKNIFSRFMACVSFKKARVAFRRQSSALNSSVFKQHKFVSFVVTV